MKGLKQKKFQLEKQLEEIAQKQAELKKELANVCQLLENIEAIEQRRLKEKVMKARKEWELATVLCSEEFYQFVQSRIGNINIKELIQSDEFYSFLLKKSYANRIIKALKRNEIELSPGITEEMLNKLQKMLPFQDKYYKKSKKVLFVNKLLKK